MKKNLILICFLPLFLQAQLSVQQIMKDPKWIGTSPSNIFWSYNSKLVYFEWNPDNKVSDSTYGYQLTNSKIEKIGFTNASFAQDIVYGNYNAEGTKIAFTHNGDVYLLNTLTNDLLRITQTEGYEQDPVFLKNDSIIVYRENNDFFAWNEANGSTKQLTHFEDGFASTKKGEMTLQQQWLNEDALRNSSVLKERKDKMDASENFYSGHTEEKQLRTIYTGNKQVRNLRISPDGRFVFYELYQKNELAKGTIVPSYVTLDGYTKELHSRSKVGRPDGDYYYYVFDKLKDTVLKIGFDSIPFYKYIPEYLKFYPNELKDSNSMQRKLVIQQILWNDDGTKCIADIFSLDNKDRWIMQLDAATGKLSLINHQHDEAWIAGPGIAWLDAANIGWIDNNSIYFQSEVTGYSHLYVYNFASHHLNALTNGKYEIQKAVLSNDKKYFYLVTNEEGPAKQNIYRINADGSNKIKLTDKTGGYEFSLSPDGKYLAFRYSYQTKPWELFYQSTSTNAKPVQVTNKGMSDEFKTYPWRDTKIFTFKARDGAEVAARIYEPKPGTKNNAAVIFVHGAGYLQNIDYWWSYYFREMMFNNLLADKGYTVMEIDYRGSAGYGRDWRTGIYRFMGGKDLNDEVDAAHYLTQNLNIDPSRIGMYGGSYGGFMTLMALFTAPDVFKAGAALRPVTDWGHYENNYTSAILNDPYTDSIAYARSSPINFAGGLKNHLLLCHGMVDVNVHFQDDVRLTQKLIELGKDNWQLAVYPLEDHGFVEPSSWTDEFKRILKLFDDNLLK